MLLLYDAGPGVSDSGLNAQELVPHIADSVSHLDLSQCVQVSNQLLDFMFIQLTAERRHHISSLNDCLGYVLIRRGQAAGQIRLLKHRFEPRAFIAMRGIRRMAADAGHVEHAPASRLLDSEAEFGIGHLFWVFPTAENNDRGS
jgi:hypothetical protein